ncbi:MAG TPA: CocE/NonD family hydrolase [Acidimicrobiales bacterium]|nr:CocE/NonD family hydrolase [Acidimicrobiales bacterium]
MSLASRALGRLARLGPAEDPDVAVDRDLPMLAEPGVTLLADRWYPEDKDPTTVPVVLLRSPYGRRQLGLPARVIAERGYQVVVQSCRGTFGSGGRWEPLVHEAADGAATLRWLAEQPWWSGRLATWGPSYLGLTQWAVAADPPPALLAMNLSMTAANFRDAVVYPGGTFNLETGAAWLHIMAYQERGWRAVIVAARDARRGALQPAFTTLPLSRADTAMLRHHVPFYQEWLEHERLGDPYWEPVDFGVELSRVPPSSLLGGWYDIFLPAQIDDYLALRAAGREVELVIGPWAHTSTAGGLTSLRVALAWMDVHLRGRAERRERWPVRLWVQGRRRWVGLPAWPPPAVVQRWHLHAGGRLDRAAPGPGEPTRYRYDPADPTPAIGGPSLHEANAGRRDQRAREARADVVTWTTDPLPAATTIAGPLSAEVWLRSSLEHTDLSVRLCDVDRRGVSRNLSDGILRIEPDPAGAGSRGVRAAAPPAWGTATREPDGSLRVRIRMWPTAVRLPRGGQLRLQVAGGAHPLFARNLGSGERLGPGYTLAAADHEILHDPAHPSGLDLPVSSI